MFSVYVFSMSVSVFSLSWSSSGGSLHQHILQRLSEEPENHQGFQDHGRALQQGSGDQRSAASLLSCCLTLDHQASNVQNLCVSNATSTQTSYINLFEVLKAQKSALPVSHRICLHTTVKIMLVPAALTFTSDSHNSLHTFTMTNSVYGYKIYMTY